MRPIVYLIGTGPGDPGLISARGARYLAAADVVLYDHLVHPRLLRYPRQEAEKIDVGLGVAAAARPGSDQLPARGKSARGQDRRAAQVGRSVPVRSRRPGSVVPARARHPVRGRAGHSGRDRHDELCRRAAHLSGRRRQRDVRARARRRKQHGAQRRLGEPCAARRHARLLRGAAAASRDPQRARSRTASTRTSRRRSSTTARSRRSARPTARCRSSPR